MVKVKFEFWKLLVFLLVVAFLLAIISVYINLKNLGFEPVDQLVLRT
jgi:hypothetical protein